MRPTKSILRRSLPAITLAGALAAALLLAGCGDFWQDPYTTSTTSTGDTATSTTLTTSATTATAGSSVTLTATVTPAAATGTVTFYDNSSSIGSETLSSGTATATVTFTTAGAQSLTATYVGNSSYASSTSSAETVTVAAAAAAVAPTAGPATLKYVDLEMSNGAPIGAPAGSSNDAPTESHTDSSTDSSTGPANVSTTAYASAPIHATSAFTNTGGTFTATDADGVEVEGSGSVTLTNAAVTAADGKNRGVLLYGSTSSSAAPAFTMTGGSLAYTCTPESTPACAQGSASAGENNPATLLSVANATATISLIDVRVTNGTSTPTNANGTLLTAEALYSGAWGAAGANGGNVTFRALGTPLAGDVIVDKNSTADLSLLADSSGTGSSLTGAINAADSGKAVSLTLDAASVWAVAGTSHLTSLSGLEVSGTSVSNIDGGGHCVYYSGTVNGVSPAAAGAAVYTLSGSGGYLAPEGTQGLACN